jgi:hypothetical protein
MGIRSGVNSIDYTQIYLIFSIPKKSLEVKISSFKKEIVGQVSKTGNYNEENDYLGKTTRNKFVYQK